MIQKCILTVASETAHKKWQQIIQQQFSNQGLFFPIIKITFFKLPCLFSLFWPYPETSTISSFGFFCTSHSHSDFLSVPSIHNISFHDSSFWGFWHASKSRKHKHHPNWNTLLNCDGPVFWNVRVPWGNYEKNYSLKFAPCCKIYKGLSMSDLTKVNWKFKWWLYIWY